MKKWIKWLVLGIITTIVVANSIPVIGLKNSGRVSCSTYSRVIKVDDEGDGDYTSIQNAVDNATAGDTIEVYSGTYNENIEVNINNLILNGIDKELGKGVDKGMPVVDACYNGNVFLVTGDWVKISGFRIRNSGEHDAGVAIRSNSSIVADNNINLNNIGVHLHSSQGVTIFSNNICKNNQGIKLDYSSSNLVINNNLSGNGEGMHFYSSSDNNILSNNINLVEEIGITLISSMGNTILSNNITSKETSIYLYSSDDNIVASNYVSNDISLDLSSNNTILSNEISTKNRVGVSLNSSSVNIILGNNINQREIGIYLYSSGGNSIVGNGVSNNRHGIDLYFSIGNLITNNDVYSNIETGISLNSSSHNVLYHNNFIDNRNNAFDNNNNTWDDGDKGNYWSDYEERYPDAQKIWPKGIWSEPYEIPGGENKDRYPLIKPYKTREKISNPASFDSLITSSWRIPFFIVAKTPKFPVDTNNHKQGIIHIPLSTLRSHLINHFRYYFPDKMFDFVTFLHLFFKIVYLSLEGFAW